MVTHRSLQAAAAALGLTLLGACAGATPRPVDVHEESTAIVNLAVVSPENLYVWNTPALIDDGHLVYSARHLSGGKYAEEVSVWKSPSAGGAAVKLVAAGEGERLAMAWSSPSAASVYYNVRCTNFSTLKSGLGGRTKLTGSGSCDYNPRTFPDGSKVLFSSCVWGQNCYWSDTSYIWVMNADGTNMTQLRQGTQPALSPDAKRIAFSFKGDIWIMGIDGGEVTNLTATEEFRSVNPAFSPDGQYLVFTRIKIKDVPETERQSDIWMMRVDGTGLTQLTMSQAGDMGPHYGVDGFLYFMSDRGPLVGGQRQQRVWRARIVGDKGFTRPPPR